MPLCSLSYPTVHQAADLADSLGRGALLAMLDLKNVHHIIPVHPDDRWLLAVQWKGQVFLNSALLFGLRLVPKIFSAVADALQWIMESKRDYLDESEVDLWGGPGWAMPTPKILHELFINCPVPTHIILALCELSP